MFFQHTRTRTNEQKNMYFCVCVSGQGQSDLSLTRSRNKSADEAAENQTVGTLLYSSSFLFVFSSCYLTLCGFGVGNCNSIFFLKTLFKSVFIQRKLFCHVSCLSFRSNFQSLSASSSFVFFFFVFSMGVGKLKKNEKDKDTHGMKHLQ